MENETKIIEQPHSVKLAVNGKALRILVYLAVADRDKCYVNMDYQKFKNRKVSRNPERNKIYQKKYYQENKDDKKNYYLANRKEILAKAKRRYDNLRNKMEGKNERKEDTFLG